MMAATKTNERVALVDFYAEYVLRGFAMRS